MAFTDRQRETLMSALKNKIRGPCPMCNAQRWQLWEGLVATSTASIKGDIAIGGKFIPMVQVVCETCGFVSHHAARVLDPSLGG